ncbi:MAG TPA: ADP-ribosylglycohydrolase family protein [Gemmatimonadales bacterium]|nr:ADP-ribosylglycohydrolase family protein [Gemmatimonadales bacterium]
MPRATPDLASRARGALLGLAAGNALGVPTEFLGTAAAIEQRYPGGVTTILPGAAEPWDDDLALSVHLAEELLEPEVSLERLGRRWIEWMDNGGRGIGNWTRVALSHLKTHGSPPSSSGGQAGNGSVSRCVPVALATLHSPRNLVSGSYHTAALTHPDERCTWGAVAVNVAAHCLLRGIGDFLPEVLDALRQNEAPAELLEAIRRVPLERREQLPVTGGNAGYVVHCVEIALWMAYHEPNLERGVTWLANAGGDTDTNAAVAGALMGIRDGDAVIPERWISALSGADRLRTLAHRLVGLVPESKATDGHGSIR